MILNERKPKLEIHPFSTAHHEGGKIFAEPLLPIGLFFYSLSLLEGVNYHRKTPDLMNLGILNYTLPKALRAFLGPKNDGLWKAGNGTLKKMATFWYQHVKFLGCKSRQPPGVQIHGKTKALGKD